MFRLIDARKLVVEILETNYPNADIKTGHLTDENCDFNVKQVGSCICVKAYNHFFVDEDDKEEILSRGTSEISDRRLTLDEETYDTVWFKLEN